MADCEDFIEEILADGTKIRTITKKDGTVVRKVVKETEGQKKLRELKQIKDEQGGLAAEEAALEMQQRQMQLKEQQINKLKEQQEMLSKKEEFKPPGVNGNIFKQITNKDGTVEYVEVNLEQEALDPNQTYYEQSTDEDGNIIYVAISNDVVQNINTYKQE